METEWIIQLYTRCLQNRNGQLATMSVEKARSSSFMTLYVSLTWLLEERTVLCLTSTHGVGASGISIQQQCFIPRWQMLCITEARPLQGQQSQSFHSALIQGFPGVYTFHTKPPLHVLQVVLQTFSVDHTDNHPAWGKQRAIHTRSLANKPVLLSWCNESGPDKTRPSSLLAKWDSFGLVKGSWLRLKLTSIHGLNPCFKFAWMLHCALHLLFKREKVCPNETIIPLTRCFVFEWNPGVFSPFSVWFFRQMRRW